MKKLILMTSLGVMLSVPLLGGASPMTDQSFSSANDLSIIARDQVYFWKRLFFGPSASSEINLVKTQASNSPIVEAVLKSGINPDSWSKVGAKWYYCDALNQSSNPFCLPATSDVVLSKKQAAGTQGELDKVMSNSAEYLFNIPGNNQGSSTAVRYIKSVLSVPSSSGAPDHTPAVTAIYNSLSNIANDNGQLLTVEQSKMGLIRSHISTPYSNMYASSLGQSGLVQVARIIAKETADANVMSYTRIEQGQKIQMLLSVMLAYQVKDIEQRHQNTKVLKSISKSLQQLVQLQAESKQANQKGVKVDSSSALTTSESSNAALIKKYNTLKRKKEAQQKALQNYYNQQDSQ